MSDERANKRYVFDGEKWVQDNRDDRIAELEHALEMIEVYCITRMTCSSTLRIATHGNEIHDLAYRARTGNYAAADVVEDDD